MGDSSSVLSQRDKSSEVLISWPCRKPRRTGAALAETGFWSKPGKSVFLHIARDLFSQNVGAVLQAVQETVFPVVLDEIWDESALRHIGSNKRDVRQCRC